MLWCHVANQTHKQIINISSKKLNVGMWYILHTITVGCGKLVETPARVVKMQSEFTKLLLKKRCSL